MREFSSQTSSIKLDELNAKFEAGKITLVEYNNELVKISEKFLPGSALVSGTSAYIQSIGTVSEQVAKGITQAFNHLEDNLSEFVKTGQFNFAKFTQSILDDLTRIIIRASIIKPLAEGILNFGGAQAAGAYAGNYTGGSFATTAANGAAFDRGVRKFAKGGIVDSPTAFRYGGGNLGLMGEAGTEAILPLKRGADGNLGVMSAPSTPVVVNIINKTDSEIQQAEKSGPNGERILEVLIQRKVRDGLASGAFDKQLQSDFGLKRKGS
jgi:lambda family phage tail tape measure protein